MQMRPLLPGVGAFVPLLCGWLFFGADGFYGAEGFHEAVGVEGVAGDEVRVADVDVVGGAVHVDFGAALEDVADDFVGAGVDVFVRAGHFAAPEAQGDVLAGGEGFAVGVGVGFAHA